MAIRSTSLIAVVLLSLTVASSALVGGWQKIDDPNAPEVVDIAKFAVTQHNSEAKTSLVFVTVVSGEQQVVSGTNYKLVISAKDGSSQPKNYEAVVWSRPWLKSRQLTSFKEI